MLSGSVRGHFGHGLLFFFGPVLLRPPAAPTTGLGLAPARRRRGVDRVGVQQKSETGAVRARRRERLDQPGPQLFAGQLHQAQRRHLGHLVAGAVAAQRLSQPTQHQVAVGLQHHVDEVDDHDAADVAQP